MFVLELDSGFEGLISTDSAASFAAVMLSPTRLDTRSETSFPLPKFGDCLWFLRFAARLRPASH